MFVAGTPKEPAPVEIPIEVEIEATVEEIETEEDEPTIEGD